MSERSDVRDNSSPGEIHISPSGGYRLDRPNHSRFNKTSNICIKKKKIAMQSVFELVFEKGIKHNSERRIHRESGSSTQKKEQHTSFYRSANAASRRQDRRSQMRSDKKNLSCSCFALRAGTWLIADTHRCCRTGHKTLKSNPNC